MKKVIMLGIIIMALSFCACSSDSENADEGVKDIPLMADYMSFDYDELKSYASLIIKVRAIDELSEQNTIIQKDPEDADTIMDVHSLRKVEVLDLYKNETSFGIKKGDMLSVIEMSGIFDNSYFHSDGYEKMEKGNVYILFLNNNTESGKYSIISANNGKVDLENISDSEYYDIAVKTVIDYVSDITKKEKDKIIKSDVLKESGQGNIVDSPTQTLNIPEEKIIINYNLDTEKNKTYVNINSF